MRKTVGVGWIVGGALAGLLWLAGCGGGDDDAANEESEGAVAAPQEGDEAGDAETGAGGAGTDLAVDTVALARREIIRTGNMLMVVEDAAEAADDVRRLAGEADGFVADEQVRARDDEVDLTVRVPAAGFDELRQRIAELGDVVEQTVEAEDVTAEVVDVETRIDSLRASVERLQGLLGRAGDVAQLATVEGELARREAELEALLGQQRVLRDQVDLATLTVHMSQDEEPTVAEDGASFFDGLRLGFVVVITGGQVALAALGFLLPLAVPAALVGLAVRWWLRRSRRPALPAESAP